MSRRLILWVELAAWLAVAAMGLLAATQAAGWSGSRLVAALQSFTPYLLAPSLVIAPVACWYRRDRMALTAAAIGSALLVLTVPVVFQPDLPEVPPGAPTFSIAHANLLYGNVTLAPASIATVLATEPDVMAFTEFTRAHEKALRDAGADALYPFQISRPARGREGIALWSKFPIVSGDVTMIADQPGIDVVIDVDGRHVHVVVVHPVPPTVSIERWEQALDEIGQRTAGGDLPTIAIGDFNTTRWHPPLRDLLATGLRDVHEWTGKGFSTSWPANDGRTPTLVRIDRALVRGGLVPTDVTDLDIPGTDHVGFVVTLALTSHDDLSI